MKGGGNELLSPIGGKLKKEKCEFYKIEKEDEKEKQEMNVRGICCEK